jgi:hypothetical protein
MLQPLAIIAIMVETIASHGCQGIFSIFRKKFAFLFFEFYKVSNRFDSAFFLPARFNQ